MCLRQKEERPQRKLEIFYAIIILFLVFTTISAQPSISPTLNPTLNLTLATLEPTLLPSISPTRTPSRQPSSSPSTSFPSAAPSKMNSLIPTSSSSLVPSETHSIHPTSTPSMVPTTLRSAFPSPSLAPSNALSATPSKVYSTDPTTVPSSSPSKLVSDAPTITSSTVPTDIESTSPSILLDDSSPTNTQSENPSISPSLIPSASPSALGSLQPSNLMSEQPTAAFSSSPSSRTPVEVKGVTLLNLYFVTVTMTFETRQMFQEVVTEFLNKNFGLLEHPISNVDANLYLQKFVEDDDKKPTTIGLSALQVTLKVSAKFLPVEGKAVKAEDLNPNLGDLCFNFFNAHGETFVNSLRNIEDIKSAEYFSSLESVEAVSEDGKTITTTKDDEKKNEHNNNGRHREENADGWFRAPFYIAIGVACGFVLIAILFVTSLAQKNCQNTRNKNSSALVMRESGSVDNSGALLVENQHNAIGTSYRHRSYTADDSNMGDTFAYSLDPAIADPEQAPKSDSLGLIANTSVSTDVMDEPSPLSLASPKTSAQKKGENGWDHGSIEAQRNQSGVFSLGFQSLYDGGAPVELTRKEVIAPPGKLGIVVDTSMNGPVVVRVKATSPLIDSVYEGDIIVAIDNVDTRAMTATAITKMMAKSKDRQRKLSLVSGMDARPVLSLSKTGSLGS